MKRGPLHFRDIFAIPAGRETVRAFLIFGILLLSVVAIGGELTFRGLSLSVLNERLDLGRQAALEIAQAVAEVGVNESFRLDYDKLRANEDALRELIRTRIDSRKFIRHVEIRDRWGVRLFLVGRHGERPQLRAVGTALPKDWPRLASKMIQVPLIQRGARTEGEVRLSISPDALQDELISLRQSLRFKVMVAGLLALGVLVLGLIYVLYLVKKNRTLEQARQSAARASYVGLLASGLAHEIRNPLNAMNMNLQMLEEELHQDGKFGESEEAELLDSTKSEIKRLERLVNNFLTYARPAQPRFESKNLNVVVQEVIRLLDADFRQSGVELVADEEPLLPHVEVDEAQFKQALINLLVNARQVLKDGGVVTIRTRPGSRGEVVMEIADTGPGIPGDVRDRIFEVFYSRRGGGTGLGLPIARQVIEKHGGKIEVDSVEGKGTTFRIRLPRHQVRPSNPVPAPAEAGQG